MAERTHAQLAVSGEPGLIEEVTKALNEVLERYGEGRPEVHLDDRAYWEQSGGWYKDLTDPWSQSGGWVLDLEGRRSFRDLVRPHAVVVRNVHVALQQATVSPEEAQKIERDWGALPAPEIQR